MRASRRLSSLVADAARQRLRHRIDSLDGKPVTLGESLDVVRRREAQKEQRRAEAIQEATRSVLPFKERLRQEGVSPLLTDKPITLQINIGKLCNLTCRHCHVESSPSKRRENMHGETVDRCLELLSQSPSTTTLDITGGAPELNPHFRRLVSGARAMGKQVIDRCNLVVLFEEGMENLAQFLAEHRVHVVASLPCYTEDNTDKQRGKRVHKDSVEAIRILNRLGYGRDEGLRLDLVYNPGGAFLPPPQAQLEADYRSRLRDEHGIVFDALLALTNMPIKRFADDLERSGGLSAYMSDLAANFNAATLPGLMCRETVNVQWDGTIYDCDFNAALNLASVPRDVWSIGSIDELAGRAITTAKHCYGCTAGSGSSCGGTLV